MIMKSFIKCHIRQRWGAKIIVLFFELEIYAGGGYGEAVGLSLQICPELYVEHKRISTMEFFCEKS